MRLLSGLLISIFSLHAYCEIPTGVFNELMKFKTDENRYLPNDYIQSIPEIVSDKVTLSEKEFLDSKAESCSDNISVTYLNSITDSTDSTIQDFESGFIRIEASRCFKNASAKKLLETSSSISFRLKAVPTLNKIVQNENLICENTSTISVGNSNYCYLNTLRSEGNSYFALTSFNTWNDDDISKFNAPVFFKYISESTKQINSDAIYHLITYVRGPKFSNFQRFFAKSYINKTQIDVFLMLEAELQKSIP